MEVDSAECCDGWWRKWQVWNRGQLLQITLISCDFTDYSRRSQRPFKTYIITVFSLVVGIMMQGCVRLTFTIKSHYWSPPHTQAASNHLKIPRKHLNTTLCAVQSFSWVCFWFQTCFIRLFPSYVFVPSFGMFCFFKKNICYISFLFDKTACKNTSGQTKA